MITKDDLAKVQTEYIVKGDGMGLIAIADALLKERDQLLRKVGAYESVAIELYCTSIDGVKYPWQEEAKERVQEMAQHLLEKTGEGGKMSEGEKYFEDKQPYPDMP